MSADQRVVTCRQCACAASMTVVHCSSRAPARSCSRSARRASASRAARCAASRSARSVLSCALRQDPLNQLCDSIMRRCFLVCEYGRVQIAAVAYAETAYVCCCYIADLSHLGLHFCLCSYSSVRYS